MSPPPSPPDTSPAALAVVTTGSRRQAALSETLMRLHAAGDESQVAHVAVQGIERALDGSAAALFEVDHEARNVTLRVAGTRWHLAAAAGEAWVAREIGGMAAFAQSGGVSAGRWWQSSGGDETRGHSVARFRVNVGQQLWGVLVIDLPATANDADAAWFATAVADHGGLALGRLIEAADFRRSLTVARETRARTAHDGPLAALSHLAGGVVREFEGAFGEILAVTDWVLTNCDDPHLARDFEAVRRAASDAEAMIERLRAFATARTTPRGTVALADLVDDAMDVVRRRGGDPLDAERVDLHLAVERQADAAVEVDAPSMREVFVALLTNAVEASARGGTITARVGTDGGECYAAVVDHGEGMDEATRGRIFEPFFSTKRARGAGLGLPLCWSVVESHGGRISVTSTRGAGSTFTVWLPSAGRSAAARRPTPRATRPESRPLTASTARLSPLRARILVVDDQADCRRRLRDDLTELGHYVDDVASAPAALGTAGLPTYDLIIASLALPGVTGAALAAQVASRVPGLPVVLMTGTRTHIDAATPAGVARVVAKPVGRDLLDVLIGELVRRPLRETA